MTLSQWCVNLQTLPFPLLQRFTMVVMLDALVYIRWDKTCHNWIRGGGGYNQIQGVEEVLFWSWGWWRINSFFPLDIQSNLTLDCLARGSVRLHSLGWMSTTRFYRCLLGRPTWYRKMCVKMHKVNNGMCLEGNFTFLTDLNVGYPLLMNLPDREL